MLAKTADDNTLVRDLCLEIKTVSLVASIQLPARITNAKGKSFALNLSMAASEVNANSMRCSPDTLHSEFESVGRGIKLEREYVRRHAREEFKCRRELWSYAVDEATFNPSFMAPHLTV